jgi:hypothetical protein
MKPYQRYRTELLQVIVFVFVRSMIVGWVVVLRQFGEAVVSLGITHVTDRQPKQLRLRLATLLDVVLNERYGARKIATVIGQSSSLELVHPAFINIIEAIETSGSVKLEELHVFEPIVDKKPEIPVFSNGGITHLAIESCGETFVAIAHIHCTA